MSNKSKSKPVSEDSQATPLSTAIQNSNATKDITTKPAVNGKNIPNGNHIKNNNNDAKSMYSDDDTMQLQLNGSSPSNEKKETDIENKNQYENTNKKPSKPARNPIELSFDLNLIDEKYLRKTQQIYYTQCPSLRAAEAKQLALFKVAAIGRKNNNYPLLLNLIDCFLRDKFKFFLSNPNDTKGLSEQYWCNNYKTVKTLIKKSKVTKDKEKLKDAIFGAIQTYFRRYCQPLFLPTPYKIRDSIPKFIQSIHEIGSLILSLKQDLISILPFQIDLVIIPQDVHDIANDSDNDGSVTDSDDFDSDDNDTDSDSDKPEPGVNKWSAEIGNIATRLKKNNIPFEHCTNPSMARPIYTLYKQYTQSASPVIKYTKGTNIKELDNVGTDLQQFPHRKRLCIVVDRRPRENDDNDNKENDETYLFEPPQFNNMPNNHIREWYIESSYKCIIPGYGNKAITSKSALDGWINVFSFHIEQEDEIKCYFYRSGQILRFMPDDIRNLFKHLFDLNYNNSNNGKFVNGKEIEKDIERMKKAWKDIQFDKFREVLS